MSIDVKIPTGGKTFFDVPQLLDSLGLTFGSRNEYDDFLPFEVAPELIVTDEPYGRGINLCTGLMSMDLHLPTPCSTSDLDVFMLLIELLAKKFKCKTVECEGEDYGIEDFALIKRLAQSDMTAALEYFSRIDTAENYFYIMTPFARIVVDDEEQASFKDDQAKFDRYLAEKQTALGINNQISPFINIATRRGITAHLFLDAGRYCIIPKSITRNGTNEPIEDAIVENDGYEMPYGQFLEKVPKTIKKFDAERIIVKFVKKDFRAFAQKVDRSIPVRRRSSKSLHQSKAHLLQRGLTEQDVDLLDKYFQAMSNFYGVISLRDALDIIEKQTGQRFSKKSFMEFARQKNRDFKGYTIATLDPFKTVVDLESDIVNNILLEKNVAPYKYIKRAQAGKTIYVPSQSKLFKYTNIDYIENKKDLKPLTDFLDKHAIVCNGYLPAKSVVEMFVIRTRQTSRHESSIQGLLRSITGIKDLDEPEFFEELFKHVQTLHGNTRLWVNYGCTPHEVTERVGIDPENIKVF